MPGMFESHLSLGPNCMGALRARGLRPHAASKRLLRALRGSVAKGLRPHADPEHLQSALRAMRMGTLRPGS